METTRQKTVNRAATLPQPAASVKSVQRKAVTTKSSVQLQTATKVSSPNEPAEKEADSTAKKIMRMAVPESSIAYVKTGSGGVFRQVKQEEIQTKLQSPYITRFADSGVFTQPKKPEEEKIQRKAEGQPNIASNVAADIQNSMATGSPLPLSVRRFMEPRFSADFGKVKIHTGDKAAKLNKQVNAQAFAMGNHIFFGKDKFKPDSQEGKELIAHELTHTIQQGAAIQRSEDVTVTQQSPVQVQRLGLGDALDYFADKANLIPGFRMFTIILGVNPINMSAVERSAANILRALIEFIPGGGLIAQALDNYGIFDKIGNWVEQQIKSLGLVGSAIKQAVTQFLDSLSWTDIFDLGGVWNRAKRIFTDPIDRIKSFAAGLVTGIIQFIKDAILRPLAKLAEGTAGYDLLKAVLGKDPVTGDPVPQTADTLIGGFMKLIGQEEVWNNLKKANAVARAWAWFKGAMGALMGFVGQIPTLFLNAFKSLELVDIVLVPRAFAKVVAVFGKFMGDFMNWAGNAVWNLLEIIFDAVSPGAFGYVKRAGSALKSILKNPLPFVGNLVKAAKLSFLKFAANIGGHLKAGLIDWLTGSLPGIYIPKSFSLGEIVKFVFSVMRLTWQNLRQKLVKAVGEPAVKAMETGFDVVVTLVTQGPAAAWDKIKDQLANLKDMVIGGITDFVVDMVVKKAIPKIVAMFIPGAGFISAILSIYDTVMVFVNKISKIVQVVTGFINSISAIANGAIDAAVSRVETTLAGLLSLAINFLAGFAGLGKVADKVIGVINKVRAPIDKALDALSNWIVTMAKKLFAKKGKDERTDKQKQRDLDNAMAEGDVLLKRTQKPSQIRSGLDRIKAKYNMTQLDLVIDSENEAMQTVHLHGEINPTKDGSRAEVGKGKWNLAPGGLKESEGKIITSDKGVHLITRHGNDVVMLELEDEVKKMIASFQKGRTDLMKYYRAQVLSISQTIEQTSRKPVRSPEDEAKRLTRINDLNRMLKNNTELRDFWQSLNPNDREAVAAAMQHNSWGSKAGGGSRAANELRKTRFINNRILETSVMKTLESKALEINEGFDKSPDRPLKITHELGGNLGIGYEMNERQQAVRITTKMRFVSLILRVSEQKRRLYMVQTGWPHP